MSREGETYPVGGPSRLEPPAGSPPRLTRQTFPPYAYVPGLEPHPVTHPEGHSFGVREAPLDLGGRRLPGDWREVEEYLYGVDLFNAAFFWEAHESWEAVWHAAERGTPVWHFLQGLIQASAAMLQHHCGRHTGAANLLARSAKNLEPALSLLTDAGAERFMGVRIAHWSASLARYVAGEDPAYPFLRVGLGESR